MAVNSSIKKYMIDGVEIPVYPTSVVPSDNLVSKSWNDMNGVFRDIPVNLKAKVNWVFDVISEKDLEVLYGKMIREKIIKSKSRFFDINTFFPGVGFIKGKFYLGAPVNFNSKDWQTNNGTVNYWQVELHWIEVDGIKLNSPTVTEPVNTSVLVNGKEVKINETSSLNDILSN